MYDFFCVLDVEATCVEGTDMGWPNEIIEWPVVLLGWEEHDGRTELRCVDTFRSYVRPKYRPKLSEFCTRLTGIRQSDVDSAPIFRNVLKDFQQFLRKHGLVNKNGKKICRWIWCTDGPYDIRDFVAKQCFISAIPHPPYLMGDIIDVRMAVRDYLDRANSRAARRGRYGRPYAVTSLRVPAQLQALGLGPFEGREHSGIDDTRNIARIVVGLVERGVALRSNYVIRSGRRWPWMGRSPGQILDEHVRQPGQPVHRLFE